MKVTALQSHALRAELAGPMRSRGDVGFTEFFHTGSEVQHLTAVEVETDTGHRGITLLGGDARSWLQQVAAPVLLGRDPGAIRHLRAALQERVGSAGGELPQPARGYVNRLEFALWDLLAQRAGLPLFRLLGGTDPQVEVYAGGGSLCWNPIGLLLSEAESLLERGFRALKIKIGRGLQDDAEVIAAIRSLCGPDIRIMVDANRAYDIETAVHVRFRDALHRFGVYWFEEPLVYDRPEEWRRLRRETSILITGGEGFSRISQATDALREDMVDVLQCDAGGFGLEGLLAIASTAQESGVRLTPHSCNNAIGFVVACHLQRALPNAELQEFETFDNPFIHRIFQEPFELRNGSLRLPETPGLGFTLNRDTLSRFAKR